MRKIKNEKKEGKKRKKNPLRNLSSFFHEMIAYAYNKKAIQTKLLI